MCILCYGVELVLTPQSLISCCYNGEIVLVEDRSELQFCRRLPVIDRPDMRVKLVKPKLEFHCAGISSSFRARRLVQTELFRVEFLSHRWHVIVCQMIH